MIIIIIIIVVTIIYYFARIVILTVITIVMFPRWKEEGVQVVLMNPNIASVQTNAEGEKQVSGLKNRSSYLSRTYFVFLYILLALVLTFNVHAWASEVLVFSALTPSLTPRDVINDFYS